MKYATQNPKEKRRSQRKALQFFVITHSLQICGKWALSIVMRKLCVLSLFLLLSYLIFVWSLFGSQSNLFSFLPYFHFYSVRHFFELNNAKWYEFQMFYNVSLRWVQTGNMVNSCRQLVRTVVVIWVSIDLIGDGKHFLLGEYHK